MTKSELVAVATELAWAARDDVTKGEMMVRSRALLAQSEIPGECDPDHEAELAKVREERDAGIAHMRTAINMLDAGHTKEQVRVWLAGFQEGNAK